MIESSWAKSRARSATLLGLVVGVMLLVVLLGGCGPELQAPSPTLNPHPHKVSHLKITVEPGSGVNRVEVYSIWTIGNIGCAPNMGWPSGASITKQVNVDEKVEKVDGYYLAKLRKDYFLLGKCKWNTVSYELKFMHNSTLLSAGAGASALFGDSSILKLVCMPPPHIPLCELSKLKETFDRTHFPGVFDVTLEIAK